MNKEVIYLEPEDDITDILTKLQQAEQKLVALVPPKKATILRSTVNMKLVARVAKECDKVAVIVTADPAIIKMAMMAKIPVAKTLQSRPIIPTEENIKKAEADEQIIEEDLLSESNKKSNKKDSAISAAATVDAKKDQALELTEETIDNDAKAAAAKDKKKKLNQKKQKSLENASFIQKYRKWIITGSAAALLLVIFLVWALLFAPAVKITVAISSTPYNFSENVRFTTDENAQDLENSVLYAQLITLEKTYKTDITATSEEDHGDKATGKVSVTFRFRLREYDDKGFNVGVSEGDIFTTSSGLEFRATETLTPLKWDGATFPVVCDSNVTSMNGICIKTYEVEVEALEAGKDYNISRGTSWQVFEGLATVSNTLAFSGGTTNMIKVIGEEDIEKVKEAQLAEHINEGKEDLLEDIDNNLVGIESSFKGEVTEVITKPERGAEVKSDDDPTAEVKITYSAYAISVKDIESFIDAKTELEDGQKIYSYGKPYFERFTDIENEARLKTTVETGPTVTKDDILEKVKGKKTGQVKSILSAINGVSSVDITTSYFWVWSVPTDPARIDITLVGEGDNK